MRKINYLLALMLSMATLGIFAQKTEKPKKDLKNQKRTIVIPSKQIKPDKKVEYPGVEWKPKQELHSYPGVEWLPKKDSLSIIKIEEVGDDTQEGLQKRIAEAERRIKLIVEERRRLSKLKSHYKEVMLESKRKLAKLQGETPASTDETAKQTSTEKAIQPVQPRATRTELEKAKNYDELERIVAKNGYYINFYYSTLFDYSVNPFADIIEAVKINGHAKLVVGLKKKIIGKANARVKFLMAEFAKKGLTPNQYEVFKLDENTKSNKWLSKNNQIWFRVEHLGSSQEQTLTEEELRERHQRMSEARRQRMIRAELEKAKDYDQLERIVAEWGKYIKFKKNSEFLSSDNDEKLSHLIKAMNINGHARLIVGVKKKGAGLANARVKRLKALIARKGLVPNMFRVSKLNKNAKSKYWLSENSHIWFRVERL